MHRVSPVMLVLKNKYETDQMYHTDNPGHSQSQHKKNLHRPDRGWTEFWFFLL